MLQKIDLSGTWKVRWTDGERGRLQHATKEKIDELRYIPAKVPGEIHLDALEAGWIQDPCLGTNALASSWIEGYIWSYRHEFDVPEDVLKCEHVWLNFEGLDYFATIVLNGEEIGRHGNFFYPCRLKVSGKLLRQKNILVVHVESGLCGVSDKPSVGYSREDSPFRERLTKRHWLRKPQCQFNWDWATRFINVGIYKPVSLEWSFAPVRVDQLVALATVSSDLQQGQIKVRWFVEGVTSSECLGLLKVKVENLDKIVHTDVLIKPGLNPLETVVFIAHPKLWWPVGHGAPERYSVEVSLEIGGEVVAEKSLKVGFRHVRMNQESHPQKGSYFIIEVNGKKIFAKGGNFVPADMIYARLDRKRYQGLVDRALEANFNLLRVWGGGLYESDDFYELCDEKGILVWQEFIFACSKYPATDEEFERSVENEAVFNIRRLAGHPSLIIWCGNNEMEWGAWDWGYDRGVVHPDHALFHITLPRLLEREDGTRYYQPSSPFSPGFQNPNSDQCGDQHPWSVGFQNTDFRDYRKMECRFPNEGGTLGPTSLQTLKACLPQYQDFPGSFAWQIHDNSVDTWDEPSPPDQMIRQWLGVDPRKMTLEEFVYWGGLLQGEGLREYSDNFRRRMFDSASAIFWMFNDWWPAVRSWTIVDYYLRRTPSFHPVRRAFSPITLVIVNEEEEIRIFGVNETSSLQKMKLRYGIFYLNGNYLKDISVDVELHANASTLLTSFPVLEWKDQRASVPFAQLTQNGQEIAKGRYFSLFFKEMKWGKANVSVNVQDGWATFLSDIFVWNICLDLDGEDALKDNFFDLYPKMPYSIPWEKESPPKILYLGNELPQLISRIPT